MANDYYLVKAEALPEVLQKVAQAKAMLETQEAANVQEALSKLGISRSSYYKYKNAIDRVTEGQRIRVLNISCKCKNQPGILSQILDIIFKAQMNVETIYQSVPVGGVAEIAIHAKYMSAGSPIGELLDDIRRVPGVSSVKLMAEEN